MKEGCGLFPNLLLPNFLGPTFPQYPTTTNQQMLLRSQGSTNSRSSGGAYEIFRPGQVRVLGKDLVGRWGGPRTEDSVESWFWCWWFLVEIFWAWLQMMVVSVLTWKCGDVKLEDVLTQQKLVGGFWKQWFGTLGWLRNADISWDKGDFVGWCFKIQVGRQYLFAYSSRTLSKRLPEIYMSLSRVIIR